MEILVYIGISFLLLAMISAASLEILKEYRRDQTRVMMKGLLGAHEEFKAIRNDAVNHDGNYPIDWATDYPSISTSSERYVVAMSQVQQAETAMIAAINSGSSQNMERAMIDSDTGGRPGTGFLQLHDRWGFELVYLTRNDGTGSSKYHTKVQNEVKTVQHADLPLSPIPFFVSAGPDNEFGTGDDVTTLEE